MGDDTKTPEQIQVECKQMHVLLRTVVEIEPQPGEPALDRRQDHLVRLVVGAGHRCQLTLWFPTAPRGQRTDQTKV